jgi:transaldolase
MPGPTLEAFADHGEVSGDTVTRSYAAARGSLDELAAAGIDIDDVTDQLERDGLAKFEKSWSELGASVAAEMERLHSICRPRTSPAADVWPAAPESGDA